MQRKTQRFLPFAVSTYWKLCQYTYTGNVYHLHIVGKHMTKSHNETVFAHTKYQLKLKAFLHNTPINKTLFDENLQPPSWTCWMPLSRMKSIQDLSLLTDDPPDDRRR